jgi:hypothetical protein
MELSIVRLKSLTRKLLTHLNVKWESRWINILYQMLFVGMGFA